MGSVLKQSLDRMAKSVYSTTETFLVYTLLYSLLPNNVTSIRQRRVFHIGVDSDSYVSKSLPPNGIPFSTSVQISHFLDMVSMYLEAAKFCLIDTFFNSTS